MTTVVVSAINIFSGGPLTVVRGFLSEIAASEPYASGRLKVIVFCHAVDLYSDLASPNMRFVAKPWSRKNWLIRVYYEYFWFWRWSLVQNVYYWVSLHDMTPNVKARFQAVYCHNPAIFYSGRSTWRHAPGFELFRRFYKYLYRINLKKNDYIIVQQQWIREAFVKMFHCDPRKVIVARPGTEVEDAPEPPENRRESHNFTIIYPALPRVFKNFEVLLKVMTFVGCAGVSRIDTFW